MSENSSRERNSQIGLSQWYERQNQEAAPGRGAKSARRCPSNVARLLWAFCPERSGTMAWGKYLFFSEERGRETGLNLCINVWKETKRNSKCNISKFNISKCNISKCDISKCNISKCNIFFFVEERKCYIFFLKERGRERKAISTLYGNSRLKKA